MLNVDGLKISISRGDTGTITITFTGQDTPPNGTIALVTLQKTMDSEGPIWEKRLEISGGRVTIPFYSADTVELSRGKYCWCLRLLYENGDVYTPMDKPQEFEILPASGEPGDPNGD